MDEDQVLYTYDDVAGILRPLYDLDAHAALLRNFRWGPEAFTNQLAFDFASWEGVFHRLMVHVINRVLSRMDSFFPESWVVTRDAYGTSARIVVPPNRSRIDRVPSIAEFVRQQFAAYTARNWAPFYGA